MTGAPMIRMMLIVTEQIFAWSLRSLFDVKFIAENEMQGGKLMNHCMYIIAMKQLIFDTSGTELDMYATKTTSAGLNAASSYIAAKEMLTRTVKSSTSNPLDPRFRYIRSIQAALEYQLANHFLTNCVSSPPTIGSVSSRKTEAKERNAVCRIAVSALLLLYNELRRTSYRSAQSNSLKSHRKQYHPYRLKERQKSIIRVDTTSTEANCQFSSTSLQNLEKHHRSPDFWIPYNECMGFTFNFMAFSYF